MPSAPQDKSTPLKEAPPQAKSSAPTPKANSSTTREATPGVTRETTPLPTVPPPLPSTPVHSHSGLTREETPLSPRTHEKRVKRTRMETGETVVQTETPEQREHESSIEDEDSVMDPRLVKGMPKRAANIGPLAKTLYPWPDPNSPPAGTENDPHSRRTRDVIPAPVIPKSRTAFTDAVFERLYLTLDSLVDNIREEQRTQIQANPGEFLAVVPLGAGAALFKEKPRLNNEVVNFLKTFRFPDIDLRDSQDETLAAIIEHGSPTEMEAALRAQDQKNPDTADLQLIMPASKRTGSSRDKFARPWAMFLRGGSKRLRDFMIYQQTFAVDKDLTFNVLKIEAGTPSWVLCNFKGDAVKKDQADVIFIRKNVSYFRGLK